MSYDNIVSIIIPSYNRKKDVSACIKSVLLSDYNLYEIIVIDNCSTDNTFQYLNQLYNDYKNIKIIRSDHNIGAGGGRNLGVKYSIGRYLLFLDSDNIVDPKMIGLLYAEISKKNFCMVGPLMLYLKPNNRIWTYFADINHISSKAFYRGNKEVLSDHLPLTIKTGHIPNCFIVERQEFLDVGGFNEFYFVMYEEADFAERLKKRTKKDIIFLTQAMTYHNVPFESDAYTMGVQTPLRAFLISRNRIYFVYKNSSIVEKFIFSVFFLPIISSLYIFKFLINNQYSYAYQYLRGIYHGFRSI